MSPELRRHRFHSMGSTVDVQIVGDHGDLAGVVERVFAEYEHALSRFRDDSELTALNASRTTPFRASPPLFDAVSEAIAWACITDGVFDPTLADGSEADQRGLKARATGNRWPAPIREVGTSSVALLARPSIASGRWRHINLDFEHETITLPADTPINLDGIGKGYTVDRAIAAIGASANALVSASGDLYAAGDGPDGDGWYVRVQDPFVPERDVVTLNVNDRGVATSGRTTDRDASGTESRTDLAAVTVIALTATQADVLSKTALLLGSSAGLRTIERFDAAECVAITRSGDVLTTSGLPEYLA